ncbi:MAG TPA: Rne/Rng family ribonuclease [Bacteroidales bacterium]|mgnify:CR=1 FL=1|nr:Rne/Rng family ribonuclease [Bacteroidales bacterium]HPS73106.1 Rne/Rng family ribonuclease [Bacteroidales bacterium]
MNKEIFINSTPNEVEIALLEDKLLVELNKEKSNNEFSVGDVYLGRVKKIMPGLNAAFVDVGYEKDAFLHYLDLGPQINSLLKFIKAAQSGQNPGLSIADFPMEEDIQKSGKINQVLKPNQNILVEIAKEPISTKGPRVTSELAFAGRYLVLMPFSDKISVSQKIKSQEERNRLKRLITSIRPKNCGIIIRTVAENKLVADLDQDLRNLFKRWETIASKLVQAKPPMRIIGEIDRTSAILRDLLNESFNNIVVNDETLADDIRTYIQRIYPNKVNIVKTYTGKTPIFENFDIDKQIKASFGKTVTIKSGTYLIIEHTEALHVIDINSGHRVNAENNQETNALEVNLEAATEVARQLRLRDMGGIIVVDFIDMTQGLNRRKLYDQLREEMKKDRAKHSILPPSKFGLVQITRQRVRPEMSVQILEKCPACEGTGKIRPSILIIDDIENNLAYLLREQNESNLSITVSPFVYAYIRRHHYRWKWRRKFGKRIKVVEQKALHFLEFHIFNQEGNEIKL